MPLFTVFVDYTQTVCYEVEADDEVEAKECYTEGDDVSSSDPEPTVTRVVQGRVQYVGSRPEEQIVQVD